MRATRRIVPLVLAFVVAGCENAGQDRVLGLDARGVLTGQLFLDRNASATFDAADSALADVAIALVAAGTRDTVATGRTLAAGQFEFGPVVVGSYAIAVDPGLLGDTLTVAVVEPLEVRVGPDDTLAIVVGVGYPRLPTLMDLASTPLGRRVVANGLVLNPRDAFGDSTVFLVDAEGSLEAVGVRSAVLAGDSIRMVGRVAERDGRRVLADCTAVLAGTSAPPAPVDVTSAGADTASGGSLSGRLVRVVDARVTDTLTANTDLLVTLDDGSGPVTVRVTATSGVVRSDRAPAAVLDVTGVLAPTIGGWRLQPRSPADITVDVAVVTASAVRTLALGTRVVVTGVALGSWNVFGDSTIHFADATGNLRATQVAAFTAAPGDSVRLTGTVATRDGQRVLASVTPERLGVGTTRSAVDVSTQVAAQASGGLDAALIRVRDAVVSDTTRENVDLVLTVSDGSGDLRIVADADAGLSTGPLVPGAVLDVTGLLVPTGAGQWRLKPRADGDITVVVPVVTVAAARTTPLGDEIVIVGVALNDRAAFGDQTVHFRDGSGSLRATGVATVLVFQGDSARFRGTVGVANGQRVLQAVTVTRVTNLGPPVAADVATATAASASGGTLDAALVRVTRAVISARQLSPPDLLLTVSDGSGALTIVLDGDAGIDGTPYQAGAEIDVTGVLVPTGTGTWRLKPRGSGDLTIRVPVLTIGEARARSVGDTVVIRGVALHTFDIFADSSLHVADTSGAMRTFLASTATVFLPDSLRVRGVVGSRLGQPVLNDASPLVVGTGTAPQSLTTTQVAAGAFGGRLDAALVQVTGTISTTMAGFDFVMTLNDGSGAVDVVLDGDIGFATGAYTNGVSVTARGVLVPSGVIGRWVLKPRAQADLTP